MKVCEKVFLSTGNEQKAGVAVLISDIDFKVQTVVRDIVGCYIMIKLSIQQENIILVSIYAPNIGTPKCIKHILTDLKEE